MSEYGGSYWGFDVRDGSDRMQVYVKIDEIGEENFSEFKKWDLGDIVGVKGFVFKTRRGEISVPAQSLCAYTYLCPARCDVS